MHGYRNFAASDREHSDVGPQARTNIHAISRHHYLLLFTPPTSRHARSGVAHSLLLKPNLPARDRLVWLPDNTAHIDRLPADVFGGHHE